MFIKPKNSSKKICGDLARFSFTFIVLKAMSKSVQSILIVLKGGDRK
jgi:hypothetical protein